MIHILRAGAGNIVNEIEKSAISIVKNTGQATTAPFPGLNKAEIFLASKLLGPIAEK